MGQHVKYAQDVTDEMVRMYQEDDMSVNGIAETFAMDYNTVRRLLAKAGALRPPRTITLAELKERQDL